MVPIMLILRMAENVSAAREGDAAVNCTVSRRWVVSRQRSRCRCTPRVHALVEFALQVAVLADDSLQGHHFQWSAPEIMVLAPTNFCNAIGGRSLNTSNVQGGPRPVASHCWSWSCYSLAGAAARRWLSCEPVAEGLK